MHEEGTQLQGVELALLGCSLSATAASRSGEAAVSVAGADATQQLLQWLQEGKPVAVLKHPALVNLLKPVSGCSAVSDPQAYFKWLQVQVASTVPSAAPATQLLWFLAGVAAYLVFLQENLVGPSIVSALGSPPQVYAGVTDEQIGHKDAGQDSSTMGDQAAAAMLQVDGEDLQGRVSGLQWLLLASLILVEPLAAANWRETSRSFNSSACILDDKNAQNVLSMLPSWSWWALRVASLQQHILSGRSATLLKLSSELSQRTLSWVERAPWQQSAAPPSGQWIPNAWLKAAAYLEAAHVQHQFLHVEAARTLLEAAGASLNLEISVTGALGKRTQHQVDPKAQLVVVAAYPQSDNAPQLGDGCVEVDELGLDDVKPSAALEGMDDNSEVFLAPQLSAELQGTPTTRSALEQALFLAWAQQVKKGSATDELQPWQMAPYIEEVLRQKKSAYLLQLAARLLKARHEMTRTRTRERALLMMEKVVEAWQHQTPSAAIRLPLAASTWFPLRPMLLKELAEAYIGMGFVGAALKVFEQQEMWEHLIVCYRLLDKKMQADTLIRQRLQIQPDDPKLWCALGDLHLEDEHYETAWQRSNQRHARSQRSLGRSAVRKKDYAKATKHYELALQLSPLYPDTWFALGYAYLKLDEFKQALTAFTRVTQMDPEHGEAWNNAAALLLQMKRYRQAFTALSETVKYKREDWRVWENYAHAAIKSEQLLSCVHGLQQVMKHSSGQQLPMDVLEQLMEAVTKLTAAESSTEGVNDEPESFEEDSDLSTSAAVDAMASALSQSLGLVESTSIVESTPGHAEEAVKPATSSSGTHAALQADGDKAARAAAERKALQDKVLVAMRSLLYQATNSPAAKHQLWGVLAQYYALLGETVSAKESLLKQVRSLQSSSFKTNLTSFRTMAKAMKSLSEHYIKLYEAGEGLLKDVASIRMQLTVLLKQTQERFEDDPLHSELQAVLQQLQQLEAKK